VRCCATDNNSVANVISDTLSKQPTSRKTSSRKRWLAETVLYLNLERNTRAFTLDSNPAHLPASSSQVPRLLLDLVRHKSHISDSHLTIYKLKPPPDPGFLLTALVRTRSRHMQRPEKHKHRERHPIPFQYKSPMLQSYCTLHLALRDYGPEEAIA